MYNWIVINCVTGIRPNLRPCISRRRRRGPSASKRERPRPTLPVSPASRVADENDISHQLDVLKESAMMTPEAQGRLRDAVPALEAAVAAAKAAADDAAVPADAVADAEALLAAAAEQLAKAG